MEENILEIRGLSKYFGTVKALNNINISIKRGEIYGLVGANGSGKSTLMNILFGNTVIAETGGYEGEIYLDNKRVRMKTTKDAIMRGIGMIHQEFALIPDMTIAENIKLSRENTKGIFDKLFGKQLSYIDKDKNHSDASQILKSLGFTIDTSILVKRLSTNGKQFVEIAREMDKENLKLLLLDEPTAVLNKSDSQKLFTILKDISSKGTAIIFISHRLDEICTICDRVSVLRDGSMVADYSKSEMSIKKLAEDMIGYEITETVRRREIGKKESIMSFRNFRVDMPGEMLKGVDLDIYDGEILGITSFAGHGKLALGYGVMGLYRTSGDVIYKNKVMDTSAVRKNIGAGVYILPDDRKSLGLLLQHSVAENIIFSGFQINHLFAKGFFRPLCRIEKEKAFAHADSYIKKFDIVCKSMYQPVRELSGGNQQKVCIARALTINPKVLFISEPTRGVDIGAKEKLLNMLLEINEKEGTTVVMASGELDELRRICDRIIVLYEGRIFKVLAPAANDTDFALALSGEEESNEA